MLEELVQSITVQHSSNVVAHLKLIVADQLKRMDMSPDMHPLMFVLDASCDNMVHVVGQFCSATKQARFWHAIHVAP